MTTMWELPRAVAMGLITCSLGACVAEVTQDDIAQTEAETEVAATGAALNGTVRFQGDCLGQDTRIKRLVLSAKTLVGTSTLRDCLARSLPSYNDYAFPEQINTALAANVTTTIECLPNVLDGTLGGLAQFLSDGTEALQLSTNLLPTFDDPTAIGLILHEISHNRGYSHPQNTASPDHPSSYPQHILECARTFFSGATPRPMGPTRYDFQTETTLAPVGGLGGTPIVKSCATGRRMAGLRAFWGSEIVALGARCRSNSSVTPTLDFSVMGGNGGTQADIDCAAGDVMVGVHGSADNRILTRIGPICARIVDVQNGVAGPDARAALRFRTAAGNPSGFNFERICPTRMVAEQLRGRAGQGVDRLELYCQRIDRITRVNETALDNAGGSGGVLHSNRCAGRSALAGLTYNIDLTAAKVDYVLSSLGGECMELSRSCLGTTCFEIATNGSTYALGNHGEGTAIPTQERFDRCPSDQALVGLNVQAGAFVDKLGGICAGTAPWSLPASLASAPTTALTMRGGNGGTLRTLMCPRQTFLVGWETRAGKLIDSVQPVCRRFD